MKLAFNSWVYSSFPVWVPAYPLIDVIERLAKIGYDGIEIGAASPHAFPDDLGPERRRENKGPGRQQVGTRQHAADTGRRAGFQRCVALARGVPGNDRAV
jgi:sugar phosphate isomerase/epimerase